jgi:signal transduction histidine kinase
VNLRRWTVRARLTAWYGALFLLVGAALLGVTYVLVARALDNQSIDAALVFPTQPATEPATTEPKVTGLPSGITDQGVPIVPTGLTGLTAEQYAEAVSRFELAADLRRDFRHKTLVSLLQQGALGLVAVAMAGIWLGWLAAGRTLRPIQQITATARRVADRSLHERINLAGPHDELRQLADTFDDMLARLDAAFDGQRRFVANASHELRTPLAINRTVLEVALSRPGAPPEIRQLGDTLLAVNARHERLIDGLLQLARSEQHVVDPVTVDLAAIVARQAGAATEDTGPTIESSVEPVTVHGDPDLLEHLVQNLVRNATTYNVPDGWVRVTCAPTPDGARLTVSNTGPTVVEYEVPRLFEPFRRLKDRVGSHRGTGLGLPIVRSVTLAHGGEVSAVPRTGGGLVIQVDLPGRPPRLPSPGSSSAAHV